MAATVSAATRPVRSDGDRHWRKILLIWFVASAILTPVFYLVVGPHIPPGDMTSSASGTQFDTNVVLTMAVPIMLAVWVFFGYAIVVWRAAPGEEGVDGPPLRSHPQIQVAWIAVTSAIVLGLFVFGTVELIGPAGAGGGEGPNPAWVPAAHTSATWSPTKHPMLIVQVIGQQWQFTYRYPQFGGFETDQLVLPNDTTVAFHVTSIDVIHDFWAYQLGIKADANPQTDNVAFTTTNQTGSFMVRCDELCGLWHGAMFNSGTVMSPQGFEQWATATETQLAANTKRLPAFAWTYVPDANGADGGYYPDDKDPYSNGDLYAPPKSG